MIPHISENPRNRKYTKRRRKRLFNAAIHALRMRVKRTFAWEDKFQRLRLRFERIPAAALWHEIEGVHVDQPASILQCLKLATSSIVETQVAHIAVRVGTSGGSSHTMSVTKGRGLHGGI